MIPKHIAIVGTGISGLAAAVLLANDQQKVHLYGKHAPPPQRHMVISQPNISTLTQYLDLPLHIPITSVHLSAVKQWGMSLFEASSHHLPFFGQLIPSIDLHQALWANIKHHPNIEQHDQLLTSLDNLDQDLIIIATGKNDSLIPKTLQHKQTGPTLQLSQSLWSLSSPIPTHQVWQRFDHSSVWAAIPIDKHQIKIIQTSRYNQPNDVASIWRHILPLHQCTDHQSFTFDTFYRTKVGDHKIWSLGENAISPPPIAAQHFNHTLQQLLYFKKHFTNEDRSALWLSLSNQNKRFFEQQLAFLKRPTLLTGLGLMAIHASNQLQSLCLNRFMGTPHVTL